MTNLTALPTSSVATAVLEALDNIVIVADNDGHVVYVSPAVEDILGFPPDRLLGDGWWDLTHDSLRERTQMQAYAQALAQGALPPREIPYERAIRTADGDTRWILWSHSRGPGNQVIGLGYDITRRKEVEDELNSRNSELQRQKREFLFSLQYAHELQRATLPDVRVMAETFPDTFVFNRPRDIVSGDFYWFHQEGDIVYLVVADCTGHGVPGALLTVLGQALLRDCVREKHLSDPAEILQEIDRQLGDMLQQEGNLSQTSDGMDIALTVIDLNRKEARFCGAFRSFVQVGSNGLRQIEGHRFPLGFYINVPKCFETTIVPFQSGDMFYLFSDGFSDQLGGKRIRRFGRRRFYELLTSIHLLSAPDQAKALEFAFDEWRGNGAALDDVLVVGWRMP